MPCSPGHTGQMRHKDAVRHGLPLLFPSHAFSPEPSSVLSCKADAKTGELNWLRSRSVFGWDWESGKYAYIQCILYIYIYLYLFIHLFIYLFVYLFIYYIYSYSYIYIYIYTYIDIYIDVYRYI